VSAWLEGRLDRVLYASATTGYAVVRLIDVNGAQVLAVGSLAALADAEPGTFASLEGRFEDHPVHGHQFRALGWIGGAPRTLAGLAAWLGSAGVKGVGPKLAERVVAAFGEHTPRVLANEPERLLEVRGIKAAKAAAIRDAWNADQAGRALAVTLRGLGLSGRLIERVRQRYGERAAAVVASDPYQLADDIAGIGFRTADALARAQGLPPDAPGRVRAAVGHVLDVATEDGHCFLPRVELARRVAALDVPIGGIDLAIGAAEATGRVAVERAADADDDRIWLAKMLLAETVSAADLARRLPPEVPLEADEIARAERAMGVALDPGQRAAVARALGGGAVVVTGGPGTGKTTLVRVLLEVARERAWAFQLASPTGRAARRLEEATGREASTLHRLLEFNPGTGGFERNFTNPLDGDGLVVDEVSMVDLPLLHALLDAVPSEPDFPLVLVGDADQLPSVGPGQVLRDLIASGRVPVARLSVQHRQGRDSGIVHAAAEIGAGRVPPSGEAAGWDDFFLLPRDDADEARETLLKVVCERLPARGFGRDDVQVLAPMRRGPLGTQVLNAELQKRLNPDGAAVTRGDREFRVGDRVMCTKNRYDVEVFNGDVGAVRAVTSNGLDVAFDGRIVAWTWDDLGLLELAYAITIHKAQGSEYPAVVVALHGAHGVMLRRNLFYTAVTRARRFACVVGSSKAWYRAVQVVGGDDRYTALAERLRGG
jgi:exodeoxyribonuclease V alpha subunit